jgi:GT2 family glycosyltransferase
MAAHQPSVRQFPPLAADEPITVVIPNYNGRRDIGDGLRSLQSSTCAPVETIVVDDGSTDDSVAFIRQEFPAVRVVELGRNSGGMLNRVRNRALSEARTRLVFLMDHDVVLDARCLSTLRSRMRVLPDAAVLTTRALFAHDRERIYVDAQGLHFLCNTVALNRDTSLSVGGETPQPTIGWGTQLIDREKAAVVGFFDEDYGMGWGDDGEFHHRIRLAGFGCYSVPDAVVYHQRVEGANRIAGTIRNRWYIITQTYSLRSLILLAPAFLLYEASLFTFLLLSGMVWLYLRAMRDVVTNVPRLLQKRRALQRLRTISDREILVGGPIYIRENFIAAPHLRLGMNVLNRVAAGYWRLVRNLL